MTETLILLEAIFAGTLILFLLISKDFKHGIYLWLLSTLFFKYQRLGLTDSVLPYISITRILFIFLMALFFIEVLSRKRKIYAFTAIDFLMFLFSLVAIISMIWSGFILNDNGGLKMGDLLTGYIFPFFMFFVSKHVYDTPEKGESLIKFILFIGAYLCITAILEHFKLNSLIFPGYIVDPGFGIHFGRARGPFAQAAVNGTALGFVLLASLYFLLNSHSKKLIWKSISWILLISTPIAIFFTYTRATWLGAFLGFLMITAFSLRHRKNLLVITVILSIALLIGFFYLVDDTTLAFAFERAGNQSPIDDRLNLYVASFNMFKEHPLFGIGFGRFKEYAPRYFTKLQGVSFRRFEFSEHDTFVGVLAEMGLVGIFLILSIYYLVLSKSIRLYRSLEMSHPVRNILILFWGFMAVYVVNSVFIEMRFFEFVNCIFFIFAGIICGWENHCHDKLS